MNKEKELVALSIYTQLIHENIDYKQADKLVSLIASAWEMNSIPFDRKVFEATALRGGK